MIMMDLKSASKYIKIKHPKLDYSKVYELPDMFVFVMYPKVGGPGTYPDSLFGVYKNGKKEITVNPMVIDMSKAKEVKL